MATAKVALAMLSITGRAVWRALPDGPLFPRQPMTGLALELAVGPCPAAAVHAGPLEDITCSPSLDFELDTSVAGDASVHGEPNRPA